MGRDVSLYYNYHNYEMNFGCKIPAVILIIPTTSSFFERWYETQSDDVKTKLKKLIDNKQFEFVAGKLFFNICCQIWLNEQRFNFVEYTI